MEDIAIYFQKINIGDCKYILKPIDVIMGKYDIDQNSFITPSCMYYEPIVGGDPDSEDFFGYPTTISKLKEKLAKGNAEISNETILEAYVEENFDYLYIGYYDVELIGLSFIRIPYDGIDDFIESESIKLHDKESKVGIDKKFLIGLKNLDSLDSVRTKIDSILKLPEDKDDDVKKYTPVINNQNKEEVLEKSEKLITLKELRKEILSKIVGQDNAVNDITRSIMINQTSKNPKNKSHILVTGPTGTGKTEIVKIICETLKLPFFEADATAYTKEGYVGKSVYSMLEGLLLATGGDIEKAQNGILVIDEIDKKIYADSNDKEFGKDMLYCLLKIMDRGKIELKDNKYFDTSNLTIILMGAFEKTYQSKLKENNNAIGFRLTEQVLDKKDMILTKDDIIKDGMPSEFIGRIGDITSTHAFRVDDLVNILNKSDISALKLQKEYFKDAFNVELINTEDYVEEIAKKAIKAKTNARELKPLIRESLKYATDEFLMGKKAKTLKLTKETVNDPRKYIITK